MTFRFLGHPSLEEIDQLEEYLNSRYENLSKQIEAIQYEIDTLRTYVSKLLQAEGILHSEENYNKNVAMERYVKSPIQGEDLSSFENFKFDNSKTASIVDKLLKPWQPNLRVRDKIGYKIRKSFALIEAKNNQIQILGDLQADMRDNDGS